MIDRLTHESAPGKDVLTTQDIVIQCVFLFHLCTIFGHLSANSKSSYNKVIKLAGKLGNCTFDDILAIYNRAMKDRCLRIVATDHNRSSLLTLTIRAIPGSEVSCQYAVILF